MTQKQKILKYLFRYGSITRMEAFQKLGVCELASRIGELEKEGHEFLRKPHKGQAEDGTKWTVTRYELARNAKNESLWVHIGLTSTSATSGSAANV